MPRARRYRPQSTGTKSSCEKVEIPRCLDFLRAKGCFVWENKTRKMTYTDNGKKHFLSYGLVGSADIIGISPYGRFLAVEVKSSADSRRIGLTNKQQMFRAEIEARGGIYLLHDKGFDCFAKEFSHLL